MKLTEAYIHRLAELAGTQAGQQPAQQQQARKKILVLVAMDDEASPAVRSLGLRAGAPIRKVPFTVYSGVYMNKDIILMTSGKDTRFGVDNVGPNVASAMATVGITNFDPDVVINIGTAGGFASAGSKIGDVYMGNKMQFHDRRIPIPNFDKYGKGDYEANVPNSVHGMYPSANVSTGGSLDITDQERAELSAQAKEVATVKEMEAAAIAQVCHWNNTPLIVIKSITDLIDGGAKTADEFMHNLKIASEALQKALINTINRL